MNRTTLIAIAAVAALSLSACDRMGVGGTTETRMENVEILPGTASDEMVELDQSSGDGTAIDQSRAIGPAEPAASTADDETADQSVATTDDAASGTQDGDVVIRPPAGGAEPVAPARPEPAKK